jgi:hypothetical protein
VIKEIQGWQRYEMSESNTTKDDATETEAVVGALGSLERAANASIRGYLTQMVYSAFEWLALEDEEVLVVEGREDIDRFLFDDSGQLRAVRETQVKDLADAINVRSEAAWKSIFNFLIAFHRHREAGRDCRLLFATTAQRKNQQVSEKTEVEETEKQIRLRLEVDVLESWQSLEELNDGDRAEAIESLKAATKALFERHLKESLPAPETKKPNAQQLAANVKSAIEWLDTLDLWDEFFMAVEWLTGLPSVSDLTKDLQERIAGHEAITELEPEVFASTLIHQVFATAAQDDPADRILRRESLEALADESAENLKKWAESVGLVRLREWEGQLEIQLIDHEQRIDALENALPGTQEDIVRLSSLSKTAMRRIKETTAGVQLDLTKNVEPLRAGLDRSPGVVLLGPSGVGKSATVKALCRTQLNDNPILLWLDAASFERKDFAELQADLELSQPLSELFSDSLEPFVVLDGLDRLYEPTAFEIVADLLDAVTQTSGEQSYCPVVLTCQTQEWSRLRDQLSGAGVPISRFSIEECDRLDVEALEPIWEAIPQAARLRHEAHLLPLLCNLKILDLIATRLAAGEEIETAGWVGESSVAIWFWNNQVACGDNRRARDRVSMLLSERQADQFLYGIPLDEFSVTETDILQGLESDGLCLITERNQVVFYHDLFGDWARLRALVSHSDDLVSYLVERLDSPLWHRAIRLYGLYLLEHVGDVDQWRSVLSVLGENAGEGAQDLLLESVVFAANSSRILDQVADDLLADEGALLKRLLGRFLSFATLPDRERARMLGINESQAATQLSHPNWPYWPAFLKFLYDHREDATKAAPCRIARLVKLWLDHTHTGMRLRQEAAAIGLDLGALAEDKEVWEREDRELLFTVALAGAQECTDEVVEFALRLAERTTEQREDDRQSSYTWTRMHPGFEPDAKMPEPAPDGPHNRVDDDFRAVVLRGPALYPLVTCCPDVAREVILACLLASRHLTDPLQHRLDEWRQDLAFMRTKWSPPTFARGPFLALLRFDFEVGLELIARLVDFAVEQWSARREEGDEKTTFYYPVSSDRMLHVETGLGLQTFLGDARVLGWSAGLGAPIPDNVLTAALMALEQYFYEQMDAGREIDSKIKAVLERTQSVPFLHVLLDVGRREPTLFDGPLIHLLGVPELYSWEIRVQVQGRHHLTMFLGLESQVQQQIARKFEEHEHRGRDLREVAVARFLQNDDVRDFLEDKSSDWAAQVENAPSGQSSDFLRQLALMFDFENFGIVEHPEHGQFVVNTALQELEESRQEEHRWQNEHHFRTTLPIQCRRWIDEDIQLSADQLEEFWTKLERLKLENEQQDRGREAANDSVSKSAELFEIDPEIRRVEGLTGASAFLICQHPDWLDEHPDRLKWCLEQLHNVVLNPPSFQHGDVPESAFTASWDYFAAEAVPRLWAQIPNDENFRYLMAQLTFAPHYEAVRLLFERCRDVSSELTTDVERLRRLVFERAHVDNWMSFVRQQKESLDEKELRKFRESADTWYGNRLDQFIHGTLEPISTSWEEMDPLQPPPSWRAMRAQWFGSYMLDFRLVRAAHESMRDLAEVSGEQRRTVVEFLRNALSFTTECAKDQGQDHKHPGQDAQWVLARVAAALPMMREDENPGELWRAILELPSEYHSWAADFLRDFHRAALSREQVPENYVQLTQEMNEYAFQSRADDAWPQYQRVWQALIGIDDFTRNYWNEAHRELASSLEPVIDTWLEIAQRDPRHLAALASWLQRDAAALLRIKGIRWLEDILLASEEDRVSRDWKDAHDSVASLLQVAWRNDEARLRGNEQGFDAFRKLLQWLADRQNSLALDLVRNIGGL